MVTFKPVDIEERVLEAELKKDPGVIEDGMKFLDHQVPTGDGFIDLLCADKAGSPTVVELKIKEDDSMLVQALEYTDWINENIDRLAERYPGLAIEEARVVLIAPSFSERLRRGAKYVSPSLDLLEFEYLQSDKGEKGLRIRSVDVGPVKAPVSPNTLEDHVEYIKNASMNALCKDIIKKIQSIDPGNIELNPTKFYLGLQCKNRNIAAIRTRRDYFYVDYYDNDEWYSLEIRKPEDFTDEVFAKIKARYSQLNS